MEEYIKDFSSQVRAAINALPVREVAKAINILQACYERDGRIYIFGNGGSLALATHWVSDINKTIFSHHLEHPGRRFQAVRLPSTESELTAWANDVGYEMVFVGPLRNYIQDADVVIAISSSGNSPNVIKAVEFAKKNGVPVIGLSGFDGGGLNRLADAKILVSTQKGRYEVVESVHGMVTHLITRYFVDYFDHLVELASSDGGEK